MPETIRDGVAEEFNYATSFVDPDFYDPVRGGRAVGSWETSQNYQEILTEKRSEAVLVRGCRSALTGEQLNYQRLMDGEQSTGASKEKIRSAHNPDLNFPDRKYHIFERKPAAEIRKGSNSFTTFVPMETTLGSSFSSTIRNSRVKVKKSRQTNNPTLSYSDQFKSD